MNIGIPKEILNNENRVALTPAGVQTLVAAGHQVYVERSAGEGAGFSDETYIEAGAHIVDTAHAAWDQEMVMKVKEPLKEEFELIRNGQIIFTYLHLAAHPTLTEILIEKQVVAIAYETVQLS